MINPLLKRLLSGLLILFIFVTLLFFFLQFFMTGDFVLVNFWFLEPDEKAAIRAELGLDQPILVRYFIWMKDLLRLDLGESYNGYAVGPVLLEAFKRSLLLILPGISVAFLIGNGLGRATAWRGRRFTGDFVVFLFIVLYAFFPPSMVFLMQNLFRNDIGLITVSPEMISSRFSTEFPTLTMPQIYDLMFWSALIALALTALIAIIFARLTRRTLPAIPAIALGVFLWLGVWAISGQLRPALLISQYAMIPLVSFILLSIGDILIVSRESVIDTVFEQYLTTARAKGVKDSIVLERHAARNALLPVMSKFIISLPYLLTGLTIIEASVRWPGIGSLLYSSVNSRDIPMVMGCLLLLGLFSLIVHLLLEVLLVTFDPRLRRPAAVEIGGGAV